MNRIQWTALTALGLACGLTGGVLLGMPLGKILNAMIVTATVTCAVGAILGSFQAIGLRRLLRRPLWWIVATVIGLGIGLAVAVITVEQSGILITGHRPQLAHLSTPVRAVSFVVLGLVAGAILGTAQWLVIRRQMPGVRHWIPWTAIGLAVALSGSSLIADLSGLGPIAFVALAGIAFGAMTSRPLRTV